MAVPDLFVTAILSGAEEPVLDSLASIVALVR
jgi:hypothetical protein